jgi:hypothetical protein
MRWSSTVWGALVLGVVAGCSAESVDETASQEGAQTEACAAPPCGGKTDPTVGAGCVDGASCQSGVCSAGKCAAAAPDDGVKNDDESDVDCGGAKAPKCGPSKACRDASDCADGVCKAGACAAAAPDDGVKNGDEADVDCGGATAPKCDAGKACRDHADCASDGCGYDKKCAVARSCTRQRGGDTCGAGETGEAGARHESCCESAEAPGAPVEAAWGRRARVDKYKVTAGRMRAMAERTGGNFRAFVASLPANHPFWDQSWNVNVPDTMARFNELLGPTGQGNARRGCDLGASRARTYWMSDAENAALGEPGGHLFSKDVLDEKMLNCVDWYVAQAFCVWDGGRLMKAAEYQDTWRGGENRAYPWGGGAFDNGKVVWKYSYAWPEVFDKGNWVYVAAPGRRPDGNGKYGHADLAGLSFEHLFERQGANSSLWSGSGSWEGHAVSPNGATAGFTEATRAYWALGFRCAR